MTEGFSKLSHKINIPKDYLVEEYINKKNSTVKIAATFGCSVPTVIARLKEYELPILRGALQKGKPSNSPTVFKKGNVSWNTGLSRPSPNKGKTFPRGEKHWNWKGGHSVRNGTEIKAWRSQVFERDNYTCQLCGKRGVTLNAHHLQSWSKCHELRFDVENGQTLCEPCHRAVHRKAA